MTLPASGFGLVDIIDEVFGLSGGKDLGDCIVASAPAVAGGSEPGSILDFASHSQDWGRVYTDEQISFGGYLYSANQGYNAFSSGEFLIYTADADEGVSIYKSGTGTPITAGDAIRVEIYTRTKQTSGSWNFASGWNNYATATYSPHSLTSSLYDYKFVLTNNI